MMTIENDQQDPFTHLCYDVIKIILAYLKPKQINKVSSVSKSACKMVSTYRCGLFSASDLARKPKKLIGALEISNPEETQGLIKKRFIEQPENFSLLANEAFTEQNTIKNILALCCYFIVNDRKDENFEHLTIAYNYAARYCERGYKDYPRVSYSIILMHNSSHGYNKRNAFHVPPNCNGPFYVNLSYINCNDLRLVDAKLPFANLRHATLSQETFFGANFSGADLSYAHIIALFEFRKDGFAGNKFKNSNLSKTNFITFNDNYYADYGPQNTEEDLSKQLAELHIAFANHPDEHHLKQAVFEDVLRAVEIRPANEKIPLFLAAYQSPLFKHNGYVSLRAKVNYMYGMFQSKNDFHRDLVETYYQTELIRRIEQTINSEKALEADLLLNLFQSLR